jgi:hypothetical protein
MFNILSHMYAIKQQQINEKHDIDTDCDKIIYIT